MKILLVNKDEFQIKELRDFFSDSQITSTSYRNCIKYLSKSNFDLALLSITKISELGLVKYINTNYPNTKVILSLNKAIDVALSVITNGKFQQIQNPLKLTELKGII